MLARSLVFTNLLLLIITTGLMSPSFAQSDLNEKLLLASPDVIAADSELKTHMESLAQSAASEHCAACHGNDLTGRIGVPNLVDFEWIWGVTGFEMTQAEAVFEIMQTILYGVRNEDCSDELKRYGSCPDTRFSQMPGYAELEFTEDQLNGLVDYVFSLSGNEHDPGAIEQVEDLVEICAECHSDDGTGYKDFGGPDLTDDIWLFGDSREQVLDVITNGRTESCPAWSQTLSAAEIKALAVWIYNLSMGY